MAESSFAYVTYIRSSPEKIWRALQEPEFTRKYWAGTTQQSEWKKGSSWKLLTPDGRVADSGQVLEHDPHKKFAVTWRHDLDLETQKEGYSRMSCELEQQGSSVKVSIVHAMDSKDSKLIEGVSDGWPMILASLKSMLETGTPIEETGRWPEGMLLFCRNSRLSVSKARSGSVSPVSWNMLIGIGLPGRPSACLNHPALPPSIRKP